MGSDLVFGLPKMEVGEDVDEVVVRVFVSGFSKGDFELEVRAQTLNIEIGREIEDEECFDREWRSSSFRGEVFLPCKVIPLMPRYSYDDGVLEVRMEKE